MMEAAFKEFMGRSMQEVESLTKELSHLTNKEILLLSIEWYDKGEALEKKYGHCRHKATRIAYNKAKVLRSEFSRRFISGRNQG